MSSNQGTVPTTLYSSPMSHERVVYRAATFCNFVFLKSSEKMASRSRFRCCCKRHGNKELIKCEQSYEQLLHVLQLC